MTTLPILTIIWGTMFTAFLALLLYKAQLTRYEEDQLFLTNNNMEEKHQQDEIVRKCNMVQPYIRGFGGAAGLLTFGIVGMYVWEVWKQTQV